MHLSPTDPSTPRTSAPSSPGVTGALVPAITRDWTCPFCPLLCDDLSVRSHGDGTLSVQDTECSRLTQALAQYGATDAQCRSLVDGSEVDGTAALARAAQLLANARRPLFGGLATDVAGARALYALAAECGAILDHLHGDALSPATLALQDRGSFFTTLSEVRSRADLLVFFGCQPSRRYPRFFTRTLAGADLARELVFVGCAADPAADGFAQTRTETLLPHADPFDTLALWSALSEGREPAALQRDDGSHDGSGHDASGNDTTADARPDATPAATLASLQARIAAARYTVVVYEPGALPGPHAALLIEALNRIVKAANRTSRAACLALGGDDGALTVNQTVTWLSGMPLRTRVSKPARIAGTAPLDHDPYRYRASRLIADGEVDALLWVASFAPQAWPASLDAAIPLIVLGHPALANAAKARGANTVFIPVATPAIDSGGHLFRVDSSVVMPLAAARGAALAPVAEIAARLGALTSELSGELSSDISSARPIPRPSAAPPARPPAQPPGEARP
ncbi:formylmethanofuran dehydrogenase [Paraburkholderia susongensis]|uniref:Formylmethanofuran dehydrogenase, subunit B n=1 Tax=Paraburkholderia susongensis TaxID=1515439 RepID=A0A1X7M0U7_9BURK|nr:formylmethanofuran dehydrogenase [Paraburkholderia susongensis]SMG59796.1 formylmethanofuran dehydrogenase, subunit B [Paraburkholderia susongensis]